MKNMRCTVCKHYYMSLRCDAFPDGIPEDIITGDFDHSTAHTIQDNDLVFEHYLLGINNDMVIAC